MDNSRKRKNENGYTLVEIVVVVVVIGVIATIAVNRFNAAKMTSNEASAVSAVKLVVNAQMAKATANSYATFDELVADGSLDSTFQDGDGDPLTASRNGYLYKLTLAANSAVISAIPQSTGMITGTGRNRIGANQSGVIYKDENNLTTHYSTSADLTAGTSKVYDQQ